MGGMETMTELSNQEKVRLDFDGEYAEFMERYNEACKKRYTEDPVKYAYLVKHLEKEND